MLGAFGTDRQEEMTAAQVQEKPPPMWAVALRQMRDPVNILLIAVAVIGIVGLLIAASVILGAW